MSDTNAHHVEATAVTQLGYVGFGVSDTTAWREFSETVLGLQCNGEAQDGTVFLKMDDYHHRIELCPTGEDDLIFHGWEVKDARSLRKIGEQIRAYGLEVTQGTPAEAARRMVLGLIKFNDPEGYPTEIYYGATIDHRPFVSPRGVRGFVAGHLGVGHIVLSVNDPDAYVDFYTSVLGAKVSDVVQVSRGAFELSLTFLHVNPRHHSLAVMKRRPPMGSAAQSKNLSHFMLEVDELDDVGLAHSLYQQKGMSTGALGRHTNDRMFSFYGDTPSGFLLEYGWDGLLIDDEGRWEVGQHRSISIWGHGMPEPRAVAG